MRDIGKNVRDARIRRGWTQEELAERLYCTRQTVSNYEQGRSRPDVETLTRIAEVLETDVTELLYGTERRNVRRKDAAVLAAAVCILTFLCVLYFYAEWRTGILRSTRYVVIPYAMTVLFGRALTAFAAGWTGMQAVRTVTGYTPPEGTVRSRGRIAALAVTAAGLLWLVLAAIPFWGRALPGILSVPMSLFYRMSAERGALRLLFWFLSGCTLRYFELPPVSAAPEKRE